MRASRYLLVLILFLVGLVWIGQGAGLIGGGGMSGSVFWAVVGVALEALAVAIIVLERRSPAKG